MKDMRTLAGRKARKSNGTGEAKGGVQGDPESARWDSPPPATLTRLAAAQVGKNNLPFLFTRNHVKRE